ncbi:peptidylprolyl isomerase [Pyxidicoccus sp. 3LG]
MGVVLGLLLAACGDRDVVADVGGTALKRADVAWFWETRDGDAAPEQALDALVDRALLAEGAVQAGLLNDPAVAARVEAARREVLANAYLDKVAAESGTEDALRQRYEKEKESLSRREVHVAHLVVRLRAEADARARTEARARINLLYARVQGGEDFAAVAREASDDAATGAKGGDLGPVREGQVDPRFFQAVAELKQGELSKPFETAFGLHVARAVESPRTVVPTFQEARGELAARARHEAAKALEEQLRSRISVKRHPERLRELARPARSEGEESR